MKVYNGEKMLLGRLATTIAKQALLGEEVNVVNCEKVVISGNQQQTINYEIHRRKRKGYPLKSATRSRLPDRFVRRAIRGMLPWKQERGREAFKRIMCYTGMPEAFAKQEIIVMKEASALKLPTLKYITVGDICKQIGGRINE